ncbi:MAG TPA: type II toxin-antitoxin system RelE/ParE family toxin [Urbifossiella sp.]|nr:type II toxin-antitoxin system RelE/ParE family toxin [Urbifossiella sp.]
MKPVVVHSLAAREIRESIDYYNGVRDGMGDKFSTVVERALKNIGRSPKASSPYPGGYRKFVLRRPFPYCIFYLQYEDRVWIAAVYHSSREPDGWKKRRPE